MHTYTYICMYCIDPVKNSVYKTLQMFIVIFIDYFNFFIRICGNCITNNYVENSFSLCIHALMNRVIQQIAFIFQLTDHVLVLNGRTHLGIFIICETKHMFKLIRKYSNLQSHLFIICIPNGRFAAEREGHLLLKITQMLSK